MQWSPQWLWIQPDTNPSTLGFPERMWDPTKTVNWEETEEIFRGWEHQLPENLIMSDEWQCVSVAIYMFEGALLAARCREQKFTCPYPYAVFAHAEPMDWETKEAWAGKEFAEKVEALKGDLERRNPETDYVDLHPVIYEYRRKDLDGKYHTVRGIFLFRKRRWIVAEFVYREYAYHKPRKHTPRHKIPKDTPADKGAS